ncbi:MAG TPA: cystatin domain-containing protein [Pyrinomonadaceae bacterium]
MKRSLLITMSLIALSMSLYGVRSVAAQSLPVAGGYTRTSPGSAEVVSAARFAARELNLKKGDLFFVDSVKSAEVQVVAGLNYRMVITMWAGGKLQDFKVVVYKNLEQEYSLTSWEAVSEPKGDPVGLPSIYSNSPIEQLMKALDEAYSLSRLARLDARRPYLGRVRIVIEHSLAADGAKDQYETRTFRTLAQADRWLKRRENSDGLPARQTRPLYECSGGSCEFDLNGGILHNQLYLTKVSYVIRRGRPYIKTIYLLDGD